MVAVVLAGFLTACGPPPTMSVSETEVELMSETVGRGRPVRDGDVICIDYSFRNNETDEELLWGQDFCFEVGAGATIAGVDQGVVGMRRGGQRLVKCPPHQHWGRPGYGGKIPPQTTLLLDLKLNTIE